MSDDQSRRTVLLVDDEQAITDALAPACAAADSSSTSPRTANGPFSCTTGSGPTSS